MYPPAETEKRKEIQNRSFHGNYGDDHVCNTVAVSEHHAEPVQKHRNLERRTAVRRGAAEKKQNLENDWLIGDESWREGNKNTFEIRLIYYADADDAKEGRESEYQYKIHFDDVDGYVIKSEGVPEKEIVFPENK